MQARWSTEHESTGRGVSRPVIIVFHFNVAKSGEMLSEILGSVDLTRPF